MDEYTFKDLIIDPETPGLESIIGKEVYFSDVPIYCIDRANKNYNAGILREVRENYAVPFFIETSSGCMLNYACIIPKKEEELEPEFVPFESADEFLDEYDNANYSVSSGTLGNKLLNYGGVWLKSKKDNSLCMVAGICDDGLVICDKKTTISDSIEYNVKMPWVEILADFLFLDGTPCGMNSLRRSVDADE